MKYSQPSLFALDFPVRTSPALEEEKASRERKAPSGSRCCESSSLPDPVGYLLRTVLLSELGGWTRSMLVWKRQTTPAGRSWWVLQTLALRTVASGPGLLPTLRANKRGLPDSHGNTEAWGRLLPTLLATSYGTNQGGGARRTGKERPGLEMMAAKGLLPTLLSRDARTLAGNVPPPHHQGGLSLTQTIKGSLNAEWCEWFMNFPQKWTEIDDPGDSGPTSPRRSKSRGTGGRGSAA